MISDKDYFGYYTNSLSGDFYTQPAGGYEQGLNFIMRDFNGVPFGLQEYIPDPIEDKHYFDNLKKAWIITRTGKKVTPLNPDPESFDILDIGWALSGEGRFANHCRLDYSVAQHVCLLAHYYLNKQVLYTGETEESQKNTSAYRKVISYDLLMHDSTEAYMKDLPYLVKPFFPEYVKFEKELGVKLSEVFKFSTTNEIIHELDRRIAATEIKQLMPKVLEFENLTHEPLDIKIDYVWDRKESFVNFIKLYMELSPDDAPKVNMEKYQEILEGK